MCVFHPRRAFRTWGHGLFLRSRGTLRFLLRVPNWVLLQFKRFTGKSVCVRS